MRNDTGFEDHLLAYARLEEPPEVAITARSTVRVLTIAISGSIDLQACATVSRRLERLIADAAGRRVVFDLSGVEFCDCAGVRVLLAAYETATAAGLACTVDGVRPHVRWLLHFTGASAIMSLTPPG
jgi:anti-sigma B factor antagonist